MSRYFYSSEEVFLMVREPLHRSTGEILRDKRLEIAEGKWKDEYRFLVSVISTESICPCDGRREILLRFGQDVSFVDMTGIEYFY
jgi:hypothetical protein